MNLITPVIDSWFNIQEQINEGFTEDEKATFLRFLKQLEQNLEKLTH